MQSEYTPKKKKPKMKSKNYLSIRIGISTVLGVFLIIPLLALYAISKEIIIGIDSYSWLPIEAKIEEYEYNEIKYQRLVYQIEKNTYKNETFEKGFDSENIELYILNNPNGKITIFYNPKDFSQSTIIRGVSFTYIFFFAFALIFALILGSLIILLLPIPFLKNKENSFPKIFVTSLFSMFFLIPSGLLIFLAHNQYLAYSSRNWKTTEGVILECNVSGNAFRSDSDIELYFVYKYKLNEVTYYGNKLDFMKSFPTHSNFTQICSKYLPGNEVNVYYSPNNLEISVIEPGIGFFGIIISLMNILFLSLFGYIFIKKKKNTPGSV